MVFGNFHNQVIHDADGFGPPDWGGVVNAKFGSIAYTDTTAKALFTLPANAEIVGWAVVVTTAFNSSGTDLLDLGDGTTGNKYADNLDVSAIGELVTGFDPDEYLTSVDTPRPIYGTYAQSVADATAGAAKVICFYIMR